VHDNASDIRLQCFSCLGIHLKFLTFCRVIIDNDSNEDATLVKVLSLYKIFLQQSRDLLCTIEGLDESNSSPCEV
jgi:hypothetical protein